MCMQIAWITRQSRRLDISIGALVPGTYIYVIARSGRMDAPFNLHEFVLGCIIPPSQELLLEALPGEAPAPQKTLYFETHIMARYSQTVACSPTKVLLVQAGACTDAPACAVLFTLSLKSCACFRNTAVCSLGSN